MTIGFPPTQGICFLSVGRRGVRSLSCSCPTSLFAFLLGGGFLFGGGLYLMLQRPVSLLLCPGAGLTRRGQSC